MKTMAEAEICPVCGSDKWAALQNAIGWICQVCQAPGCKTTFIHYIVGEMYRANGTLEKVTIERTINGVTETIHSFQKGDFPTS